jgi:hypothetical protein
VGTVEVVDVVDEVVLAASVVLVEASVVSSVVVLEAVLEGALPAPRGASLLQAASVSTAAATTRTRMRDMVPDCRRGR